MKGMHKVKALALLVSIGLLAACAGKPDAQAVPQPGKPVGKGCSQADWQAETVPLLNKRSGPENLEKYDTSSEAREQGCP